MSIIDILPRDDQSRTEEQIERIVENAYDVLDVRYLRNGSTMTQADYDMESDAIRKWADIEYHFSHRVTP